MSEKFVTLIKEGVKLHGVHPDAVPGHKAIGWEVFAEPEAEKPVKPEGKKSVEPESKAADNDTATKGKGKGKGGGKNKG